MPVRYLKPGLTTSRKWNAVSHVAQSFYVRLLTLVDDYGRYDADPIILRSYAWPRSNVPIQTIVRMCKELSASGLALFYERDGKAYLQLTAWTDQPRSQPKFPEFSTVCKQLYADPRKCSSPSESPSPSESESPIGRGFEIFWERYPRKVGKGKARRVWERLKPDDQLLELMFLGIEIGRNTAQWKKDGGMFIPHPTTWLNREGWLDQDVTGVNGKTWSVDGEPLSMEMSGRKVFDKNFSRSGQIKRVFTKIGTVEVFWFDRRIYKECAADQITFKEPETVDSDTRKKISDSLKSGAK